MLTKEEISEASQSFDETDIALLTPLVRNSVRFRTNPSLFSDFSAKLSQINGSVKAKQVNAALKKLIVLGSGEVRLQGGEDAIYYSKPQEREAWVNYIISVLYPISEGYITAEGIVTSNDSDSFSVGQREVKGDFI